MRINSWTIGWNWIVTSKGRCALMCNWRQWKAYDRENNWWAGVHHLVWYIYSKVRSLWCHTNALGIGRYLCLIFLCTFCTIPGHKCGERERVEIFERLGCFPRHVMHCCLEFGLFDNAPQSRDEMFWFGKLWEGNDNWIPEWYTLKYAALYADRKVSSTYSKRVILDRVKTLQTFLAHIRLEVKESTGRDHQAWKAIAQINSLRTTIDLWCLQGERTPKIWSLNKVMFWRARQIPIDGK